ncbi:hypothetical protein OVY01_11720 [Robbsia sp. Bb-Pol-6]|uniref:Uncharacterized protein n=1 Tax=Robbsia betulipollinis TaxID=2981849 RepID=A0ABT3ZN91_9BURK|nr:hypothetical protein [Robbsia betulipollinis]MCY0387892.1 hypothetical protein [Robbsia betulipollinis]
MLTLETLSDDVMVERLNRIAALNDDVSVSPEIAGLFLARSPRSLERLRSEGAGPPYVQDKHGMSTARNHAVTYRMGDLRRWRDARLLNNPREAAVRNRKGLSFEALLDLQDDEPWFVTHAINGGVETTVVVSHANALTIDELDAYLTDPDISVQWRSTADIMSSVWLDGEKRQALHDLYVDTLQTAIRSSENVQESIRMVDAIDPDIVFQAGDRCRPL